MAPRQDPVAKDTWVILVMFSMVSCTRPEVQVELKLAEVEEDTTSAFQESLTGGAVLLLIIM